MVHCDAPYVEHYSRQPDNSWRFREDRSDATHVPLPNLECELSLAEIHEGAMKLPG